MLKRALDKASQGTVNEFDFLGIEFRDKLIRPSSASWEETNYVYRENPRHCSKR